LDLVRTRVDGYHEHPAATDNHDHQDG
jgi:hypothetical protein